MPDIKYQHPVTWDAVFEQLSDLVPDAAARDRVRSVVGALINRDHDLEDYLTNLPEAPTASRSTTLVVAASNSSAAGRAGADYVCDGTADNVEIQAAIDSLDVPFEDAVGEVVLLEGTYNLTTMLNLSNGARRQVLRGMGDGTELVVGSGPTVAMTTFGIDIKDMKIKGGNGKDGIEVQSEVTVDNVTFENCDRAIYASDSFSYIAYFVKILNCKFEGCGTSPLAVVSFDQVQGGLYRLIISGCIFDGSFNEDVRVYGQNTGISNNYININNNHFYGDVYVRDESEVLITGNNGNALTVHTVDTLVVVGNIFYNGYTETACTNVVKDGNSFTSGSQTYTHTQGATATTWTIDHNLGFFPAVTVVDSGGTTVYGELVHVSDDQATVSFTVAFSGKAYCS